METVMMDVLQQLKELQHQKEQLFSLNEALETNNRIHQSMEQKLARLDTLQFRLSEDQMAALKSLFQQQMDELRANMKKNPAMVFTTKHYSLFPASFRLEHFPVLVNTVMKWIVILIAVFFVMWLVTRYVPSE